MKDLVSRVQAASANQPDWLQKKRQLAATLLTHFSTSEDEKALVEAWEKQLDTTIVDEDQTATTNGLVNLPLFQAAAQYPAMCQEDLMEKGLSWQGSQLNALHLALLNGGRFLYLPNETVIEKPVVLDGHLTAENYHTLIIVGSHCHLTITDQRQWESSHPLFAGIELLIGAHSEVSYLYNGQLTSPQSRLAFHAYQAYGAQLRAILNPVADQQSTVDLQSNLDGDGSQSTLSVLHAASEGRCQLMAGVNTHQVGGHYQVQTTTVSAGQDGRLDIEGTYAGNGED